MFPGHLSSKEFNRSTFCFSLCFLMFRPGRLARSGREGGRVCTGWQGGPPPPEAKWNFNWSPQQSDLPTPDAKKKLFLIIKVFATNPPPSQKRKEKIGLRGPRDEVDSMVCFQKKTKGKLRNSDQLVQYSGLVWSVLFNGLVWSWKVAGMIWFHKRSSQT